MKVEQAELDSILRQLTISRMCEINDLNFTMLKVVEEATEVSELLVKSLTKIESLKPSREDIVEELGDLKMRIEVLEAFMKMEDEVKKRLESKLAYIHKQLNDGTIKIGTTVVVTKKHNDETRN